MNYQRSCALAAGLMLYLLTLRRALLQILTVKIGLGVTPVWSFGTKTETVSHLVTVSVRVMRGFA